MQEIKLEDVGKEVQLPDLRRKPTVRVVMAIKAPRGIMRLFDQHYISPDSQCEAIKAFMEEHSYD